MKKTLIAYFSAGGTTKKAAVRLADLCKGDLYEIRPLEPYTANDLNWTDKKSRSSLEMADLNCRPKMLDKVDDMENYDTVFIGFPIWWYREPSIVDTFLEAYDFRGKRIVPFCTSGGSGIEKATERIRQLLGGDIPVDDGKRIGRLASGADLKGWLEECIR